MSCLLPPACVFCRHFHYPPPGERLEALPSCAAFQEIPEPIFLGQVDHAEPYPGDVGIRFELIPAERENLLEINEMRVQMGMIPYRVK
jgi:hypothetical protein